MVLALKGLGRSLGGVLSVTLITTALSFSLLYLAPADPATLIAAARSGGATTSAHIRAVRQELHLDQPVPVQYLAWISRVSRGNLGTSFRTGQPVMREFWPRGVASLKLAVAAQVCILLISLPMALLSVTRGGVFLTLVRGSSLMASVVPEFWLGFLLVLLFAVHCRWLPVYGTEGWQAWVLPVMTLTLVRVGVLARHWQIQLRGVARQPYLRAARARGYGEGRIWLRHAAPNTAVPTLTVVALHAAGLLSSGVVVERIFAWPGLGPYFLDAVEARDLPVIQACVLWFALVFVLCNLVTEVLITVFDPQLRARAAG